MIVKADLADIERLTEIALESKAHWNYTPEQIESWREDLTITQERYEKWYVFNYIQDDKIAGFCCLDTTDKEVACVEFLFILPKFIGRSIGSKLLKHAIDKSMGTGKYYMNVYSDPNAQSFYEKHGFEVTFLEESSIPGRFLPHMVKDIRGFNST